jgi:putative ABC transport system substrate-binding protein
MAYGPGFDLARHFQQAATYVDRILKGVKPGDLPVQAPDRYRFVINLKGTSKNSRSDRSVRVSCAMA